MIEEWKEIEGFSRYKVSNTGKVWDTKNNKEVAQVLAGVPQYYYVNINSDSGERKLKRVHRFVAEAFVEGKSEDYDIVDHIDRDKFNNHYTNLRWTDTSGNQRNTESSIFIGEQHLKEFVQGYENPVAAYSYIFRMHNEGVSIEEAVLKYDEFLLFGRKRKEVEWLGQTVNLNKLCESLAVDYESVCYRLQNGWPIWNAIYNVPEKHFYSLEVPSCKVSGYWYSAPKYFIEEMSCERKSVMRLLKEGKTYEDIKSYDGKEHLRITVQGITGTIEELCNHFGVEPSMVETRRTRYGMTLEEALTQSKKKVKVVYLDGERMFTKTMYEHFGINPKRASSIRSRDVLSIHETLDYFGVDISKIDLKY